jgi:hypothetical protein
MFILAPFSSPTGSVLQCYCIFHSSTVVALIRKASWDQPPSQYSVFRTVYLYRTCLTVCKIIVIPNFFIWSIRKVSSCVQVKWYIVGEVLVLVTQRIEWQKNMDIRSLFHDMWCPDVQHSMQNNVLTTDWDVSLITWQMTQYCIWPVIGKEILSPKEWHAI